MLLRYISQKGELNKVSQGFENPDASSLFSKRVVPVILQPLVQCETKCYVGAQYQARGQPRFQLKRCAVTCTAAIDVLLSSSSNHAKYQWCRRDSIVFFCTIAKDHGMCANQPVFFLTWTIDIGQESSRFDGYFGYEI